MMDPAEIQKLLASGDVDALRRLLKRESNEEPESLLLQSVDLLLQPSTLFASRPSVRLSFGTFEVEICNHRSMGKLLWPAGQAIAEMLAGVAPAAAASSLAVLEIGAGAGVPALIAAQVGARVAIATDFTEESVELLRYNDGLNGQRLTGCARLDVGEPSCMLECLRQHGLAEADPVLIVACECSYDPTTVTKLFVSAGQLLLRPGAASPLICSESGFRKRFCVSESGFVSASPLICFARADVFAHLDEHTFAAAHASGFTLCRRERRRAAGVLDATLSYLTPCAEDAVDCFFFVREADADAALPHPILDVLPHAPQAGAATAPPVAATASELASEWALPTLYSPWALPNLELRALPVEELTAGVPLPPPPPPVVPQES